MTTLRDFWYVAATSDELTNGRIVARTILDEPLVFFRDTNGKAVALEDRCLHRHAPLSLGRIERAQIVCGYHGWTYDGAGQLVEIPSLPDQTKVGHRCVKDYAVREQEGYVYIRLGDASSDAQPFALPMRGSPRYRTVRLVHRFQATVTNCAENFVDVPHTAYVHPITFRAPTRQRIEAQVVRENGSVTVTYENEIHVGAFRWFLNPKRRTVRHIDRFVMPNITSVEYDFGEHRHLFITSQSVPVRSVVSDPQTIVYTDVTFDYGIWSAAARPFVTRRARRIIAEDVDILAAQARVIARSGEHFSHSPIDLVHVFIESIRGELEAGRDPRLLPPESRSVTFLV